MGMVIRTSTMFHAPLAALLLIAAWGGLCPCGFSVERMEKRVMELVSFAIPETVQEQRWISHVQRTNGRN
jgi:hypothetical protein